MAAWAKFKATETGIQTHSLVAHSADAGAVMERLLNIPTIADRVARLAKMPALDPVFKARLGVLAAIHDMGKANRGFWNRQAPKQPGFKAGHIGPVVDLLHWQNVDASTSRPMHRRFVEAMRLDELFKWTNERHGLAPLLNAVLMHHGRLPGPGNINKDLWRPADNYDPADELDRIGSALATWFPQAFAKEPLALPLRPQFLHAYAGLVMLADWIASDARYFLFAADADPNRIVFARRTADEVIRRLQLDPVQARTRLRGIADVATPLIGHGRTLRPAQAAMLRACIIAGSIIIIEAETGSGKTEAALLHFLNLFRAGLVDGLYFALPTRAAAVQIHRRITEALKTLLGDAAPPVVLAVPGYLRVDDQDGVKLPDFEVQWSDNDSDGLRDRAWAAEHPKRYLAAPVAVGTIDQLMLGALNVRHAQLRSAPMLRQLLVFDEIHASDVYMERVVRNLLQQHRAAGGHALLMSATLGTMARRRLLGEDSRTLAASSPPVEELAAQPYPAIHAVNAKVPPLPAASGPAKSVTVELVDTENINDYLARRAVAAGLAGARVLVIRNRVDDARETARLVAEYAAAAGRPELAFHCAGIATVHHGRFAPSDRRSLDAALEAALGRGSHQPVIAVTTQTGEQSLDIDADLLLTDICPADVLLQRLGRLHRHDRVRPAGFTAPLVVVVAPAEDRLAALLAKDGTVRGRLLGLGKVYPNLVGIAATRRVLAELGTIEIPRHNRLLVERATHEPFLRTLAKTLGPTWSSHQRQMEGIAAANGNVARLNLLQFDEEITETHDLDAHIATRLGADNRLVRFEPSVPGPFGAPVDTLSLPGWMARGAPLEAEPANITAEPDGSVTFTLADHAFHYDCWGLTMTKSRRIV